MKVQVWRSGGLLGRRVEWDVVIDEQPDPDQWYLLIAELPWHEHIITIPVPDRYTYEIRCDPHEVVIPEQELVGPWRELVDRVREANKRPRPSESPEQAGPAEPVDAEEPVEAERPADPKDCSTAAD
ncbi:protealysin inhibitor emfourin [Salinibacterium sp. M195]|uniref:protealysin inhibitor emfourin n=1 Tax=Salinibacterium sp. M195 TaxID=2583374 RepID=UPI001C630CE2|nr:protealysin inhibitor emfourin [Salinibacterium sp. M195]